jgi:hypothetical protein
MSTAVACMALALCCLTVFYGRVVCLPTDEQRQGGTAERLAVVVKGEQRTLAMHLVHVALARMGLLLLFLYLFISCRRLFHPGTMILFARLLSGTIQAW